MLTITQLWLDLFPNWETEEGWQVGQTVNIAAYINGLSETNKNKVKSVINEHPPHRPS